MISTPDHECRIAALCADEQGSDSLAKVLAAGVQADLFTDPACREIFRATCELYRLGKPIASWHVREWLEDHGILDDIGGIGIFADRTSDPPTSVNLATDVQRLIDWHKVRRMERNAKEVAEIAGAEDAGPPDTRIEAMTQLLNAALAACDTRKGRDVVSIAEAAARDLEQEKLRGLSGPFPYWDQAAGEIAPGNLVVLAARTGIGKTSLALQYAWACIQSGKRCTVFSLEMSAEEILQRIAIQQNGPSCPRLELASWIRANITRETGLVVHDVRSGRSVTQIEALARLESRSPGGLGLVVVDYLQLVEPPREAKGGNREREVAAVSRAMKLLAGELNVPVMLLSQLNRECEKEDRRPRLTDLRESGSIEQDADAVWFIHPDTSGPIINDADFALLDLIQAKRRNGPANLFTPLKFEKPAIRFQSVKR